MTFKLRPYQRDVVSDVLKAVKQGYKRILIVAPTGAGKTAISTDLAKQVSSKTWMMKLLIFLVKV